MPTTAAMNGFCVGGGLKLARESCVSRDAGSGMEGTLDRLQN